MPEVINRTIASVCAELHFAPTEKSALNLLYQGVPPKKIFITGNTVVDACLQHVKIAKKRGSMSARLGLSRKAPMVTVTAHRAENVDDRRNLDEIYLRYMSWMSFK